MTEKNYVSLIEDLQKFLYILLFRTKLLKGLIETVRYFSTIYCKISKLLCTFWYFSEILSWVTDFPLTNVSLFKIFRYVQKHTQIYRKFQNSHWENVKVLLVYFTYLFYLHNFTAQNLSMVVKLIFILSICVQLMKCSLKTCVYFFRVL